MSQVCHNSRTRAVRNLWHHFLVVDPASAAPLSKKEGLAMNTAASQSEGSTREQYPTLDLTATHHWACGMPLSYVLEVAERWLTHHEEAARLHAPGVSEGDHNSSPQTAAP
jgi:hypothetical protein